MTTYKIVRFRFEGDNEVVDRGLTLEEAQAHCRREDTHGDGWFDGYDVDDEDVDDDEDEEETGMDLDLQELVNSGMAWRLEGAVGRAAMAAIEAGQIMLGEVGHTDYWGNYVPSRYEVQPGTVGSAEYVEAHADDG